MKSEQCFIPLKLLLPSVQVCLLYRCQPVFAGVLGALYQKPLNFCAKGFTNQIGSPQLGQPNVLDALLLCTAGVGLASCTVGFCTGTASSLLTAVFCAGTASSCLTASCCTGATRGFGRITAAFVACASPPTAEAGSVPERAALGRFGVGPGSAGLAFCNAGFCTDAAA